MQDLGREALLLAQQAEQQMLGTDVLVGEPLGLFRRVGEHALALVAQRQVHRGGDLLADRRMRLDLLADRIDRRVRTQESVGERLVLADQAEEEMLGFNVRTAELAGLVACEEYNPASFLGIAFKHNPRKRWPACRKQRRMGPRPVWIIITARRSDSWLVRGVLSRRTLSRACTSHPLGERW